MRSLCVLYTLNYRAQLSLIGTHVKHVISKNKFTPGVFSTLLSLLEWQDDDLNALYRKYPPSGKMTDKSDTKFESDQLHPSFDERSLHLAPGTPVPRSKLIPRLQQRDATVHYETTCNICPLFCQVMNTSCVARCGRHLAFPKAKVGWKKSQR